MKDYNVDDFSHPKKHSKNKLIIIILLVVVGLAIGFTYLLEDSSNDSPQAVATTPVKNNSNSKTIKEFEQKVERVKIPISLPKPENYNKINDNHVAIQKKQWVSYNIKAGDNLSNIFKHNNLSAKLLHEIINLDKITKTLAHIKPEHKFSLLLSDEDQFEGLKYELDKTKILRIVKENNQFTHFIDENKIEKRIHQISATIENSLFLSAQNVGIPDKITMELANIFGWDVDFALDIRSGDQFTVIYNDHYINGEKIKTGEILAAEFVNKGQSYKAIRFTHNNISSYYTPSGKSMKKAFIRTPVNFSRISSRFSLRRWHPIHHRFKAHKGVDYAAPKGTKIKSTGNGKIIFKGRKKGYGKTIIIQHGKQYSTLYAHLSRFGNIFKGKRVKQNNIIGYVGSTGYATGPHLHYEFRVNGVHRNPLTIKLPKSKPISSHVLAQFKKQSRPYLEQLELVKRTLLASN